MPPDELLPPLPDPVYMDNHEKEVFYPTSSSLSPDQEPCHRYINRIQVPRERRSRKRLLCPSMIVLILIAIGLGLGLGLGLGWKGGRSSSSTSTSTSPTLSPPYALGGAIDPAYSSLQGAFNGSGIALASQSFSRSLDGGTQGSLVIYFQHYTGQIRWQQLGSDGKWRGGSESEVVAINAKNATPLSAVSYVLGGSSTWHIFYLDVNNNLRQRSNSNSTNVWVDGPLNKQNFTAFDNNTVGMQACWYGDDYGDSDYSHTPVPGTGSSGFSTDVGMHLWYASDETTFQQLGWRAGDAQWTFQQSWTDLNGHAGVGCYSWGPGTVTYVMFVDTNNTVNFYWKDTNTNSTPIATHPINKWTKAPIAIHDVHPATSLGYTNYFYAQMADTGAVNGYQVVWQAENTSLATNYDFTVEGGSLPIGGSHMSVTAVPSAGGGNSLLVFYQTNGSDITAHSRDWVAGQWTSAPLPIP